MKICLSLAACCLYWTPTAVAFEGRIAAEMARGGQSEALLYTVGTNFLRVEMTNGLYGPTPVDILDLQSGQLTLLFPQNRSFVRLPAAAETRAAAAVAPTIATAPGPAAFTTPPNMPAMPMGPMPLQKMELQATGQTTNILGFACRQYEIKQRGRTMEIWATDQLLPFVAYARNQPRPGGGRMMEERWPALLAAQKLFPLRASLRQDNGVERFRFEVKSVTSEKLTDEGGGLFQPPPGYFETQPLPF